jgi:multiple sugar transport system permease protein
MRVREALVGYLFVLPPIIGLLVFIVGPILASLYFSFTDYNIIATPSWVGMSNYRTALNDPLFWQSLKVTAIYASVSLPLGLVLSLGLALLMNQDIAGVEFWRTVYYLPSVISGVAVATLWAWLFNPEFGLINGLLGFLGIPGVDWLFDKRTALPALIIMSLWSIGGNLVIYLSGLQSIPTELYEAAEIDGASGWRKLISVTLPLLSPVIFFNLVMGIIGVFQWFTEPYVMTRGGPQHSTLSYQLNLYRNAFSYFKMGYASALAWILFLIIALLTLLVFRSSPLWVHYEAARER